jgi:signal transduction histidine kinase
MTLRVLTHELRTPINHIIGYSEILLEDLGNGSNTSRRAIAAVHATGKELLTLVNRELGSAAAPDETVPPELIATVRSAVRRSIDRIPVDDLARIGQENQDESADDVMKILNATTRLAEFARAGTIRTIE